MTKFVICIGALFTAFNSYADGIQKPNDSSWWSFFSSEAEQVLVLRVAEPFVDLRSGPATGYPVFHVSERGETLTIISRKTDWVNVKDSTGRTGWVSVADVQKMQNLAGSPVMLMNPNLKILIPTPGKPVYWRVISINRQ